MLHGPDSTCCMCSIADATTMSNTDPTTDPPITTSADPTTASTGATSGQDTSSTSGAVIGGAIGGVIAGVLLLIGIVLLCCLLVCMRRKSEKTGKWSSYMICDRPSTSAPSFERLTVVCLDKSLYVHF